MNQTKHQNRDLIHSDRKLFPVTRQVNAREVEFLQPFAIRYRDEVQVLMPLFRSDGGSVPRFAWWFQSPFTGRGTTGFYGHDGDYHVRRGFKLARDWRMKSIQKQYGVSFPRRWIMFIILALFGWFAWWKSPKEDDNVLYFHISQTDEIKLALKRGNTIARLMAEKDRRPAEHTKKFLDNEMQSVKNGDIDDLLKKELRSNGS